MRRKNTTTDMMKKFIADSLLILMARKAYDEISIGEITDKAGVNRSTYYRNFNSKSDIIKEYFNNIMYEYLEYFDNQEDVSLNDYLYEMFSTFYKYKKELLLIHKNNVSYLILESLNEIFTDDNFTKSKTLKQKAKIYYHTGGIYNTFLFWFSEEMKTSPKRMSEVSAALLPKGTRPMLHPF